MPLTKSEEAFAWPPKSNLTFFNGRQEVQLTSKDRRFDLADNLMMHWPLKTSRTIYFALSTTSPRWSKWDEESIKKIEWRIRYDLGFDGYYVTIKRMTKIINQPCSEEFIWKLIIRNP